MERERNMEAFDVNITRQTNLHVALEPSRCLPRDHNLEAYEKVSNSRNIYECSRTLHKSLNPDIDKANPLVLDQVIMVIKKHSVG